MASKSLVLGYYRNDAWRGEHPANINKFFTEAALPFQGTVL